eukprot:m.149207 g.149207  ORF g.149207 m.149207 type:complete len:117 (+) comp14228_c0_seq1:4546-4896(+)
MKSTKNQCSHSTTRRQQSEQPDCRFTFRRRPLRRAAWHPRHSMHHSKAVNTRMYRKVMYKGIAAAYKIALCSPSVLPCTANSLQLVTLKKFVGAPEGAKVAITAQFVPFTIVIQFL